MSPEQKKAAARDLLNSPVVLVLLREMEQDAIDQIISADPKDDSTRAAYAGEVRAIRNFRDNLNLLLEEGNVSGTRAPA
jgi:hypothetical protein